MLRILLLDESLLAKLPLAELLLTELLLTELSFDEVRMVIIFMLAIYARVTQIVELLARDSLQRLLKSRVFSSHLILAGCAPPPGGLGTRHDSCSYDL